MARHRTIQYSSIFCTGSLALLPSLLTACAGSATDEAPSLAERASDLREAPPPPNPPPLSSVPVPAPFPTDIVDNEAAIRLGKALFWDVQTGGDGQTACASCHFHAGADDRRRNTVHPGPDGVFQAVAGPGETWNGVSIGSNDDDRIGSQG